MTVMQAREERVINRDFLLQSAQTSGEHPIIHRATGFTEAYRFLTQITLRWR